MFGKKIGELTEDDFCGKEFNPTTVVNRFVFSRRNDASVKDSTILRDLSVIRYFISELEQYNVFDNIDCIYLKNDCLNKNILKIDGSQYDVVTNEIFANLIRFTEKYSFNSSDALASKKYVALIRFLYMTGTRVSTTFSFRWSSMKITSPHGESCSVNIYIDDPASKSGRAIIPDDVFDEIYRLFFHENVDDKVFEDAMRSQLYEMLSEFSSVNALNVSIVSLTKAKPNYLRRESPSYISGW